MAAISPNLIAAEPSDRGGRRRARAAAAARRGRRATRCAAAGCAGRATGTSRSRDTLIDRVLGFLRTRERHAARRHRRGLHDRGRRLAVDREAVDDLLEVLDVADVGAHHVAVLPRHAVALDDLGRVAGDVGDLAQLARRRADADHDAERVAERARVDVGAVAADHAVLLEPSEPVGDRRGRQPDAAAELGQREPRVVLQLREQPEVGGVQRGPKIRSHRRKSTCELPCDRAADRPRECGHAPPTASCLLRRQRDLPLPRPRLRGAAVRPRRRPRRRVAADRLRRARVRAVAPPVAAVGATRPRRADAARSSGAPSSRS